MLIWRNYLDIICAVFKVLIEMATIQMATSGATELSRDFYEVCLAAMRIWLQSQRLEKIYGDDEEQPEDVLMIVELFKKLTIQYVFEQHGESKKHFKNQCKAKNLNLSDHSIVANLGVSILTNLMPKMYPILQRFPDIAMAYYKSLNCFVELLVCNNEVGL